MQKILVLLALLFVSSCARAPLKRIEDSMTRVEIPLQLKDGLAADSFFITLKKHILVMKNSTRVRDPMVFGETKISKNDYTIALEKIFEHQSDWQSYITDNFIMYEVYGGEKKGEVLTTGYYQPKIVGSHEKTIRFSQALYSVPKDLVNPFYERKIIEENNLLAGRDLELAWVEPIDAFFIQIQGSGIVEFLDGQKMRIGYAGSNGRPYVAIGKFLTDFIPLKEMSMQKIKSHLQSLTQAQQQEIFNQNPSYVFFQKLDTDALTFAGMEVSDGRTIASDDNFFPKGALAFLDFFDNVAPRLVFDQDIGGAIKGGGHIDLYCGEGEMAAEMAGNMKLKGRLYYLVPKF
jgi:membrane-bound lytic murein transglycosylase A